MNIFVYIYLILPQIVAALKEETDQPQTKRKIFVKHISDKGLPSKKIQNHLKLNNKKTNNPIKN